VELHPLSFGIAALNEPWAAIDVHQAPVVIVINCGAQDANLDLLCARVVHILGVEGRRKKKVKCQWLERWRVSDDCHQTAGKDVSVKEDPRFLYPLDFKSLSIATEKKPLFIITQHSIWSTCITKTKFSRGKTYPYHVGYTDIFYSICSLKNVGYNFFN
jgi:hypothetical protein